MKIKLIDVIGELKNTSSMEHNFIVSDFNDLNTLEKNLQISLIKILNQQFLSIIQVDHPR